jgi:catechol 2,3-dioxygenase-like lactoylglutathione lyase family enzyme
MQIQQILETCLYAPDLAAAETFYSQVLGLEPFARVASRHVFFRCGPGVFLLFNPARTVQAEGPLPVPAHGAHGPGHVAFAVAPAEIPAWRDHLQRHGVEIEAEITWPSGGQSLYFRDPAGNSIELATRQTWQL